MKILLPLLCFFSLLSTLSAASDRRRMMLVPRMTSGQAASSSTLNNNLIAYWKLDEASGTRNDSQGANHLTDNNTVASATGKINDAADFVAANNESLSIGDNAALSTGDIDFTFAAWVYVDAVPAIGLIAGKGVEWYAYVGPANAGSVVFGTGGGSDMMSAASSFTAGSWHHIVVTFTAATDGKAIIINDGTPATGTGTAPTDAGGDFRIGSYHSGAFFFDGLIDECGFWKRVLTAGEITELYAAGSGKTCCPFAMLWPFENRLYPCPLHDADHMEIAAR